MTKKTYQLELSDDFRTACAIFGFAPREVIQEFIDLVSLPVYFSDPGDKHRWANLFFLDYIDQMTMERPQPFVIHERFMERLIWKIKRIRNREKLENACRNVMRDWNQAVRRDGGRIVYGGD